MRPVDKGAPPDVELKKYGDAEPYLEQRIGAYCSFCEMSIKHVPEVEHKEAKARGGAELEWDNFLLSCKYCNTRKGTKVGKGEKDNYLWPDEDDTFHVFSYEDDVPKLDEDYLKKNTELRSKAKNLFQLVKLDNIPTSLRDKDKRYSRRIEAHNCALKSKDGWDKVKQSSDKQVYLETIVELAESTGFFSVWMTVFKDEYEVKNLLIDAFKGTKREYCIED